MSKTNPTNIAASVKQRLLNRARTQKEDFNLLLTKYGLERILYRISQSRHKDLFILKGALLFELWTDKSYRPTRDADFLSQGNNDPARFKAILEEICAMDVQDDGLRLDPESVTVERIKEDEDYEGLRVTFLGYLEAARLPVQIDIGFGDAITPAPVETEFPTLLDMPFPVLLAYPRETVVAEKVEALVKLGISNTRMKDFYDLKTLSDLFSFDSLVLAEAIRQTFERRKTQLPVGVLLTALTAEFYDDDSKKKQWSAFNAKNKAYIQPLSLKAVTSAIRSFVMPLLTASIDETPGRIWQPGGPWS